MYRNNNSNRGKRKEEKIMKKRILLDTVRVISLVFCVELAMFVGSFIDEKREEQEKYAHEISQNTDIIRVDEDSYAMEKKEPVVVSTDSTAVINAERGRIEGEKHAKIYANANKVSSSEDKCADAAVEEVNVTHKKNEGTNKAAEAIALADNTNAKKEANSDAVTSASDQKDSYDTNTSWNEPVDQGKVYQDTTDYDAIERAAIAYSEANYPDSTYVEKTPAPISVERVGTDENGIPIYKDNTDTSNMTDDELWDHIGQVTQHAFEDSQTTTVWIQ